jgi:hypothetical protein
MTDITRCTVGRHGEKVCPRPARWRVTLGCVHEHTATVSPFCTMHLDDLLHGRVYCARCRRAGCECRPKYQGAVYVGREAA